ncbi:hypothetical protein MYU51_008017 [Penicillium brevicompactum]
MNQDRSREESKPTPLAQLGQFSKLPPELRFQIWNYLFDDFKSTSSSSGPISILFCNRGLYEETSRILYEHRVFSLTINIDSWIEDSLEFTAIVEAGKISLLNSTRNRQPSPAFAAVAVMHQKAPRLCLFPMLHATQTQLLLLVTKRVEFEVHDRVYRWVRRIPSACELDYGPRILVRRHAAGYRI